MSKEITMKYERLKGVKNVYKGVIIMMNTKFKLDKVGGEAQNG